MIQRRLSRYWRKRVARGKFKAIIEQYLDYRKNPPSKIDWLYEKILLDSAPPVGFFKREDLPLNCGGTIQWRRFDADGETHICTREQFEATLGEV